MEMEEIENESKESINSDVECSQEHSPDKSKDNQDVLDNCSDSVDLSDEEQYEEEQEEQKKKKTLPNFF